MTLAELPSADAHPGPTKLRSWADQHTLAVPDLSKAPVVAKYWGRKLPELAILLVPKLLGFLLRQVKPTWRGFGKCFDAYHNWLNCHTVKDSIKDADSKKDKAALAVIHHRSHSRRLGFSLIVAALLIGLGWYAYFYHFTALIAAGFSVLFGIHRAGLRERNKTEEQEEFIPVIRPMYEDGMPLKTLTASIKAVLTECGLEVELGAIEWSIERKDYRIEVSCYKKLTEDHLRAIERGVGWKDNTARWIGTEAATTKTLVARYGDPYADIQCGPILPPNSRCISQSAVLGVSYTDKPFALTLAGSHIGIVMQTGGGKTEWALNSFIAAASACHNAALVAIDLTHGPAFPMWHDVIQKFAYTPETVEDLLNWLIEERDRRMQVLRNIARSSDPNDTDKEWTVALAAKHNAPAIICFIDELPQMTRHNGTKDTINLIGMLQELIQTSRKVWISFVVAAQSMGKSGFGTTDIYKQITTWVVGPCHVDDSNAIFEASGRADGYNPELLRAGKDKVINDAGRVYVDVFDPEVFCFFFPPDTSSIKRTAAERVAAGRPDLEAVVDAVTLPPALATLLSAMDACDPSADRVSSAYVATWLSNNGSKSLDDLRDDLREECGTFAPVTRPGKLNGATVWCYWREDVDRAVAAL